MCHSFTHTWTHVHAHRFRMTFICCRKSSTKNWAQKKGHRKGAQKRGHRKRERFEWGFVSLSQSPFLLPPSAPGGLLVVGGSRFLRRRCAVAFSVHLVHCVCYEKTFLFHLPLLFLLLLLLLVSRRPSGSTTRQAVARTL